MASTSINPSVSTTTEPAARVRRDVRVAMWPIVLVLYASLLPREIRFSIGEFQFYADRIGLVLILPYVVRKIMDGAIRFVAPDFLVVLSGIWMIIAMSVHYGLAGGLQRGGSLALDATVGYFLARISFRSLNDMRRVLIVFAPGVFAAGLSMMFESTLHREIVQPLAEKIFGKLPYYIGGDVAGFRDSNDQIRLGLMRAKGPFSHSILGGLYLATLAALYNMSGLRGIPRVMGNLASLCSFFSLSSAALLALALSYALIIYESLQKLVRELSWQLLIVTTIAAVIAVNFVSNSGMIGVITRYLTLDPATAYFRQMIWRYATQSVHAHPLFGIGFEGYNRPEWMISESIDAHWLLLAVRFGIFPAFALLAAVLIALVSLGRAGKQASPSDRRFYHGIAISLFVLALSMFTVTLWGGVLSWFNFFLGGCVACAQHSYRSVRIEL